MQQLAVVYFPKNDVEDINSYREKYDPSFRIIPPHITLVSPLTQTSENELIEYIANVVKDIKRFSIRLNGLSRINDNLIFLLVKEGNEEFLNLHDRLYSGILTTYIPTDFSFIPHITLGNFKAVTPEIYANAYSEAEGLNFDIKDTVGEINIIKGDGITPANIVKTVTLLD